VLETLAEHEAEVVQGSNSNTLQQNYSVLITIALSALQHPTLAIRKAAACLFAATAATAAAWAPALKELTSHQGSSKTQRASETAPGTVPTSESVTSGLMEMQITPGLRRPVPGRHTSDHTGMDQPILQLPPATSAAAPSASASASLGHMPAVLTASVAAAKRLADSALQVLQEEAEAGPR
jgi:hypothetical protein